MPSGRGDQARRRGVRRCPPVHNLGFDLRPAVIVRPADSADVVRTVALAQASGLSLAVRSGAAGVYVNFVADEDESASTKPIRARRTEGWPPSSAATIRAT